MGKYGRRSRPRVTHQIHEDQTSGIFRMDPQSNVGFVEVNPYLGRRINVGDFVNVNGFRRKVYESSDWRPAGIDAWGLVVKFDSKRRLGR